MFKTGDRVKIAPHTDLFMMGETYAKVIRVGRKLVTIEGERSGRTFKFRIDGDALEIV
jgi:hypothetical protein